MTHDPNDPARLDRLNEERATAQEAARLLEHPLIRGALSSMKDELMEAFAAASLTDTARHTMLTIAFQQLARFEAVLMEHIDRGNMATTKLLEAAQALARGDERRPFSRLRARNS